MSEDLLNYVINMPPMFFSVRRMPPKRAGGARRSSSTSSSGVALTRQPSAQEKQALSNMFKRIESSDQMLVKCSKCDRQVKSCLMRDHLETKCENRPATDEQIKQELVEIRSQQVQTTKKR